MEGKNDRDMNLFDLIVLCCKAVGRFVRCCVRFLGNMLRLSWRCWYIVLPVVLLALVVALYWSRPANRMYQAGAMVHLNGVHANDVKQQWEKLAKATPMRVSEEQSLEQLLQIPDSEAVALSRFVCYNVIDLKHDSVPDIVDFHNRHNLADTVDVVMDDYLYLQFRTSRPSRATEIGQAALAFLNGNPLMQQKFLNYRSALQQEVSFCQQQIEMMDSLTYDFYFNQATDKQFLYSQGPSVLIGRRELRMLHSQIFELFKASMYREYPYSIAQAPVVPVTGFTINPRAVNGLVRCSVWAVILGYIVGCILALCVDKRKEIHGWLSRKD